MAELKELLAVIRAGLEKGKRLLNVHGAPVAAEGRRRTSSRSNVELNVLTPRELEVLRCVAAGQSNKEIASALRISTKTVETHRSRIMNKLDVHSVVALVRYAFHRGLVEL